MSVPVIVRLPDLAATEALAERLAAVAHVGDCILLEGPLGAGKTALARAFLRAAAGDAAMEVPSPSFTLVQIYDTKIGQVFHYDLWRLDGSSSLTELDWEDALDGIVLVEWPDRLGDLRPEDALTITLRLGEGEAREATLLGWEGRLLPVAPSLPVVSKLRAEGRNSPRNDDSKALRLDGQATATADENLPVRLDGNVTPGRYDASVPRLDDKATSRNDDNMALRSNDPAALDTPATFDATEPSA